LTTRQPCQACGGRGGPVGPCPECGELPGVDLIGARGSVPEGEHRVTTPRTARRRAVAVIGIVVALVAMSMIWDGGGVADGARDPSDGDAEADEQGDDGSTTSTSRPRRATTTTLVRGSDRDPEALTEPIPGFEDQWLVVVGSRGAWQMSLAGGEPIRLGGVRDGESQFLVDGYLVGHQGGISLRDGHRWQVPQRSIETEPGMHVSSQGWVVGVTSTATIVVSHDDTFVELTSDGAVIREVLAPSAGSSWTHPRAVSGRYVLFEGPHGLYAHHLDTRETTRVAFGRLVAELDDRVAIEVCDEGMRCTVQLVGLPDGQAIVDLGPSPAEPPNRLVWMMPSVSPDGERLAFLADQQVTVVDLVNGGRVGAIPLDPDLFDTSRPRWSSVHVVWGAGSDSALVVVTRHDGSRSEPTVPFAAVVVDRDLQDVRVRTDLQELLGQLTISGGSAAYFVSSEAFEPWTP
jgi:hypothetical protein